MTFCGNIGIICNSRRYQYYVNMYLKLFFSPHTEHKAFFHALYVTVIFLCLLQEAKFDFGIQYFNVV